MTVAYEAVPLRRILFGFFALASSACSAEDDEAPNPAPGDTCSAIVADADCDESLRPFVFVHGTFGSATEVSNVAHLMGSNGYSRIASWPSSTTRSAEPPTFS
jgi:hypothetical protein